MRKTLSLTAALAVTIGLVLPPGVASASFPEPPLVLHELTPCTLFDTRPSQGGTGALAGGEARAFHVVGSTSDFASQGGTAGGCGIPGFSGGTPQTEVVFLNLVSVDPAGGGNLRVWATDVPEPSGGVLNYQKLTPNLNNANALVIGVRKDSEGDDITVRANVSGTHVRGVALGYLTRGEVSFWALEGNSGTDPAANFLGTTDDTALNFRVNDARALRLEPTATSPNVIGGHPSNTVTAGAFGATIGGGGASDGTNRVTDIYGTVGGGRNNQAGDSAGTTSDRPYTTVGGGNANVATGAQATVGGGGNNTAIGTSATVGGGGGNTASGSLATVPGGSGNNAAGLLSFAAGHMAKANHDGAFVWADSQFADMASSAVNEFAVRAGGGVRFVVGANTCQLSTGTGAWTGSCAPPAAQQAWLLSGNVGTNPATNFVGTTDNTPLNFRVNNARILRLEPQSTSPNIIGGFSGNLVGAGVQGATIGGGGAATLPNSVYDNNGTIGGGQNNQAGDNAGTVDDRRFSTVGGGFTNTASGEFSTVGGGSNNTASANAATVAGGNANTASGAFATVPGGFASTAAGATSFAAGTRAKANHQGAFVWADSQFADMASTTTDQFIARAAGRFFFQSDSTLDNQGGFLNTSTGAFLSNVGVWTNASDAALKTGFTAIDPAQVLDRVSEMPITSWSYRAEPGVIHIGPTAQDFQAAFGLGSDDETIGTVDADGVALAAIQGLHEENLELKDQMAEFRASRSSGGSAWPQPAMWAMAGAVALAALILGRRWGMAVISR